MRTNIEINDSLLADAMRVSGAKTKREAVELGLTTLLKIRTQAEIRNYRGKLSWDGDRGAMRRDD